jgi:N-acetyl-alpha-D-glucosaminyl L-malate synthase BshA
MKIGITCHPSAGGSGILATELGIAMAHRGHEIHFVTSTPPFRLIDFHENIFYHTVDSPSYPLFRDPPMSLALTAKICEVAEENGIELWHAHYAIPHAMCAIMAKAMMAPDKCFKVVTTLHGTDITLVGTDPSFHRITRYSMEQSDEVTSVSNWLTQETVREFKLVKPIRTIYNFIDAERFVNSSVKRCTFAEEDEKIIMHISNFRPVKRVTDVVRVFKKVSDQIPARLVMVGDGPERLSAIGVARQLGITDRIRWLGTNEKLEHVLPCADLVF